MFIYKKIIILSTPTPKRSKWSLFSKTLILVLVWGSIIGLILPSFSFAQEEPKIKVPDTLKEAREMVEKAFETVQKKLPIILERTWQEEVLPVWQKMYNWFKVNIWSKIQPRAKEEIEKRKQIIEEEFPKEKEGLKEEVPMVGKSLWERFKELIR